MRVVLCALALVASTDIGLAQVSINQITPLPNVATAQDLARAGSVPLGTVLTDLITKGTEASITTGLARTTDGGPSSGGDTYAGPFGSIFKGNSVVVGEMAEVSKAQPRLWDSLNPERRTLILEQIGARYAPVGEAIKRGFAPRLIEFDSRFESNVVKLASLPSAAPAAADDNRRIWNGVRIPEPDPFGDAVALTGSNGSICSGTLVTPDTVVTAGHCYCGGVMNEAVIGRDIISPVERVPIDKVKSKVLISCDKLNNDLSLGDIALVKLSRNVTVPPRKIAPLPMVRDAVSVRAVGFGRTQTGSFGFKYQVNIVIASVQCDGTALTGIPDQRVYGCRPSHELVAATLNRDTCGGDSGGPVYTFGPDASLYLAGLTSRAVDPSGKCGPGGVYVLLSASPVREWLAENGIVIAGNPQ